MTNWWLIAFQVAKDSSVEKAIDKIKNWYFEKEGNIYCLDVKKLFHLAYLML